MNPLKLKSINLKNINLFWVKKVFIKIVFKNPLATMTFLLFPDFPSPFPGFFSALSNQGLFETLTTMTCVTNERELSPDIRVRNKTPVVQ